MCTNLRRINGRLVPCRKCAECVAKQANAVMQVLTDAAKRYKKVQFFTITYDNASIPMFMRKVEDDVVSVSDPDLRDCLRYVTKTGDEFYSCRLDSYYREHRGERAHPELELKLRKEYFKDYHYSRTQKHGTVFVPKVMNIDGIDYYVTPSLDREDIKNWLKRCRTNYERMTGNKLEFKYYCLGEYGPQTCRPHYHGLFFGLDYKTSMWCMNEWRRYNGTKYNLQSIAQTEGDYQRCTKYVSNYINKASFEPRCVKEQLSQKPRQMSSCGLIELTDRDLIWYQGLDLGIDVFADSFDRPTLERILDRQKRTVNNRQYSLSEKYKNKYFKYEYEETNTVYHPVSKEIEVVTKKHRVNTPLQAALTHLVQVRIDDLYNEQLEEHIHNFGEAIEFGSEEYYDAINDFNACQKHALEDRKRSSFRKLQRTVTRSVF